MTFAEMLRESVRRYSSRTALVFEGRTLTYAQLFERSCRLANALRGLGLAKGDRVAILEDNRMETVEEICGVTLAGLVRTPLYTQNPGDAQLHMLNLVGAKALIVQDKYWRDLAPRIGEASTVEQVIVHGDDAGGAARYDELLSRASGSCPNVATDDDDDHVVRFSAGTTGRPKGIVHTQRAWLDLGDEMAAVLPPITSSDTQLIAGPMSHGSGLLVWPVLAAGARQIIMPAFDAGLFLHLVESERATFSLLVPTMIQVLANHPDATKRDLSSLRWIGYSSAPIAEQTLLDARKVWGNIMHQMYGQSECFPVTVLPASDHIVDGSERERRRLRSAGRPTPTSSVKIVDDDGRELPTGAVGEIVSRSRGAMRGIWGDPEATAARFTPDGFVRSRDLGWMDEDGYLFIADRKEDMIISGGFNIWPAELENVLYAHPAVAEVVVVGVPHVKWGETPKAVVVLREGRESTERELIDWCKERVGSVKKPTSVEFRSEPLPKSGVGKILRREVREPYWKGEERAIRGS